MKNSRLFFILIFSICFASFQASAQMKPHLTKTSTKAQKGDLNSLQFSGELHRHFDRINNSNETATDVKNITYPSQIESVGLSRKNPDQTSFKEIYQEEELATSINRSSLTSQDVQKLVMSALSDKNIELVFQKELSSPGLSSFLFIQQKEGIPVYGAEIKARIGEKLSFNGYLSTLPFRYPQSEMSELKLRQVLVTNYPDKFSEQKTIDIESEEVWFAHQHRLEKVIHYTVYFGNHSRYEYFVSKENGSILRSFESVCKLHPWHIEEKQSSNNAKEKTKKNYIEASESSMASGRDLFGVNREFATWYDGQVYWMLDKSRPMFNSSASTLPYKPSGAILTLTMLDQNGNYTGDGPYGVVSGNNSWNDPYAVSAHYNAGIAYDFFRNKYGRNSIDNAGMNIISIINQRDENEDNMDNAYWNGRMMFYGNGKDLFIAPLAKSLDVAGHEMTHGVVQSTANLEYYGEPGALNESFADIFGVVIEGKNWQLGEDVLDRSVIRTGALRDMSNPNNGGNSLQDVGYQPKLYRNRYTGSQDNNGVHINSGIPNYAFYLFASEIGIENAADIYYSVLTNYLTKSSNFATLRKSVEEETKRLFGANSSQLKAAQNAFGTVGIGSTSTVDPETPTYDTNNGDSFILATNARNTGTTIYNTNGESLISSGNLIEEPVYRRPSISDDGSVVLYLDQNKKPKIVLIDWSTGNYKAPEFLLSNDDQYEWRNAAISKDGTKLALLSDVYTDQILVYDAITEKQDQFTVYNPTYAESIVQDVEEADAIEWDHTGGYLIFDALNSTASNSIFDESTSFWDIGFLHVWSQTNNNFANGSVQKLFRNLPQNSSVGNPTFSKNHPNIIAFDFVDDESGETAVYTMDLETSDIEVIWTSDIVGYPNYSTDDRFLLFNALNQSNERVVGVAPLAADNISPAGDPQILIEDAYWGYWFSNGQRNLPTSTKNVADNSGVYLFPNPVRNNLSIRLDETNAKSVLVYVKDIQGKTIMQKEIEKTSFFTMPVESLNPGVYLLQIWDDAKVISKKFIKN